MTRGHMHSLLGDGAATCAKWEGGVEGGRLHPAHRVAQVIIIAVK